MTTETLTSNLLMKHSDRRTEHLVAGLLILLIFALQISAAFRQGALGQDFTLHYQNMLIAASKPFDWVFGSYARTNPPLFYSFGGLIYNIVGKDVWPTVMGVVDSIPNILALGCIYLLSIWLISSPILRLSLLAFVGFLPAFQVPSVVFAADAFCQAPYFLGMVAVVGFFLGKVGVRSMVGGLTLAIGLLVSLKYSAISLIPAGIGSLLIAGWVGRMTWKSTIISVIVFGLVTTVLGSYWIRQNPGNVSTHFNPAVSRTYGTKPNQMNLRSMLFFRAGDLSLLSGPSYWDLAPADRSTRQSLYQRNYFSYPGLLWFSTFSDALDIFQPKPKGGSVGKRTEFKKAVSRISCDLGLLWFIGIAVLVTIGLVRAASATWRRLDIRESAIFVFGVFAVAWHFFIMALLPTVGMATVYGYWLPRLIVPALLSYAFLAFRTVSILNLWRFNWVKISFAGLVVCQCFLHILILT
jgi:hypothetical protein